MKIIITGGNGYIGSRLSLFLSKKGHQVIAICYPEIPKKQGWNENIYKTLVGNVGDYETIEIISKIEADAIIHLVSLDHFDSEKTPNFVSKVNVQPTWNLLDSCIKNGLKKFIYFSTIHVYGKNQQGFIKENQHPTPFNAYGLTHFLSEEVCNYYNRKTETSCINLRLSNSYGEPIFPDANCWDLVVNNLCLSAVKHGKIVLKGDGSAIRDFINYETICESVEQLLSLKSKTINNTIHLSSGNSISMLDAANSVRKVYIERYNKGIDIYINEINLVTQPIFSNHSNDKISNEYLNSLITMNHFSLEKGINKIFDFLEINNIELKSASN